MMFFKDILAKKKIDRYDRPMLSKVALTISPSSLHLSLPCMKQTKTKAWRYYLKWVLWILLFQFILANISASIYAHKFTHFYDGPPPERSSQNIITKTWKLFVGPKF